MGRADEDELEDELDEDAADENEADEAEVEGEETADGRRLGGFVIVIALGALVGAATALLFAPASGHVTRRRLRRKLEHARELAGDQWEDLSRRAKREIKRRVESVQRNNG